MPLGTLLIVELALRRYDTGHDEFLYSLSSRMPPVAVPSSFAGDFAALIFSVPETGRTDYRACGGAKSHWSVAAIALRSSG